MSNNHKEVTIIKSETWMRAGSREQGEILNETIRDYVENGERIISIQLITVGGLNRFWLYTQKSE